MTYLYGMRLRGFSPGCQPVLGLMGRLDESTKESVKEFKFYHDILEYDRKLANEELEIYELDYLGRREE